MGPTWATFGQTWGQLEPTWANLGPTWNQFGANLAAFGFTLAHFRLSLERNQINFDPLSIVFLPQPHLSVSRASRMPCGSVLGRYCVLYHFKNRSSKIEVATESFDRKLLGCHVARYSAIFVFFLLFHRITRRCLQTMRGAICSRTVPTRVSGTPWGSVFGRFSTFVM